MAFTVTDFHDLIRLLYEYPEWQAELRLVLLPQEVLMLPQAVHELAAAQRRTEQSLDRLTERMERGFAEAAADRKSIWERMERGFAEAAADRQRIWEAIRESNERMERGFAEAAADRKRIWEAIRESNERMEKGFAEAAANRERIWERMERGFAEAAANRERIWERMERGFAEAAAARAEAAADRQRIWERIGDMQQDIGRLKGMSKEQYYRDRAVALFGRFLTAGSDATQQVVERLHVARQAGQISTEEYDNVLAADLLWSGRVWETGETVLLVLEASWTLHATDVERAAERAEVLRRVGLRALPVAAGEEWPGTVETLARQEQVVIAQDGRIDEASWQAALAGT